MLRLLFVLLLPLSAWSQGLTAYTALGLPDRGGHVLKRRIVEPIHAGAMEVQLEGTTLNEVQHAFGGKIRHGGDAAGSVSWLCYASSDTHGKPTLFWFLSNEEMSSADHSLSEIALQVEPPAAALDLCDKAPATLRQVTLGAPALGASLGEVQRHFGVAAAPRRGFLTYYATRHLSAGPVASQAATYRLSRGKVVTVAVSQVTVD